MARKTIPLKDKAIIKKRLAEGCSLRKAIEGTVVQSPHTAKSIGEEESHSIAQIRKDYLLLIEGFGASEIERAELWAKMTVAKRPFGKDAIKHADWKNRAEALKYIDSLRGVHEAKKEESPPVQVNVFNRLSGGAKEFVEG